MNLVILHIVARGIRRGSLFESEADFELFMSLVKRFAPSLGVKVIVYCLMDNHYHLLVICPEAAVSAFMHRLNRTYAEAFNKTNAFSGHVFEGRGRAFERWGNTVIPCVAVYVLLNPLKAGMVAHPRAYPRSSYRFNVGDAPLPEWMDDSELLQCFSKDPKEGRQIFREFLESFIGDIPVLEEATAHWMRTKGEGYRAKSRIHAVELATLTALAVTRAPNLHELQTEFKVDEIDLCLLAIGEVMQPSNAVIASAVWAVYRHEYTPQGIAKRRRSLMAKFARSPELYQAMVALAKRSMLFVPRPKVSIGTK